MTWTMLAAVASAAALVGCSSHRDPQPAAASTPHDVTLTDAQQQSIHLLTVEPEIYHTTVSTTGVVDFDQNRATQVLAPFSGAVTKLLVTLGETVKPGQPLAEVHSADYTSAAGAYRKAVLAAKAADSIAANDRDLYARQAISQRENVRAQADAAGADADRAAALQALVALHLPPKDIAAIGSGTTGSFGMALIRAPIGGTVVERSIAPGQLLAAGTTQCFTVADTSKMWVMANLFGKDIDNVHRGDKAEIDTGDGGKPLIGTVTNIAAVVNPDTRSVAARVEIDNAGGTLKKAMYVQVHIQSRVAHSGILIPVSAVLRNQENLPFVYVAAPGGGYTRQRVTLGPRIGDRFVVHEGLHSGSEVVVDGGIFLRFIETQ